jgi:hypothetical protein
MVGIIIVVRYRKQLDARKALACLSYVALPLIAFAVNLVIVDLMLAHCASALTILIIYVNIHIQKERLVKE